MSMFSFDLDKTLTSFDREGGAVGAGSAPRGRSLERARGGGPPAFTRDNGTLASSDDLANQFIVFQLGSAQDGPALVEATAVESKIEGSDEQPDVLAKLNLISFHVGTDERIDKDARATMRINFGRDPASTDRFLDTAFWAIAAGFKLYDEARNKTAQNKELAADMNRAFGNRPIEIAGGLGLLSFEVVRHTEPPWWKKVFSFMQGATGQTLTSVLGFPAVTQAAIGVIDELLGRLDDDAPDVLFKSAPMRLALTRKAHAEFTGGNPRIRLGSLAPGYCLLARGRDVSAFAEADAVFYPTFGLLAPQSADPTDMAALTTGSPLHKLTYAVFRVQMKSAQLDPSFNFQG